MSAVGGRAAQKAATRGRVLAAARALFGERGLEGTTVRAVAERAGVAAGTVLLHGGSKEALLQEVFYDEIEAVFARAAAQAARLPTARARLGAVLGALAAHLLADRAVGRALVAGLLFPPGDAGLQRHARSLDYVTRLAALVAGCPDLRPDVPPLEAAALAFQLHVTNLIAALGAVEVGPTVAARRLDRSLDLLFAGVGAGKSRRAPATRAPR